MCFKSLSVAVAVLTAAVSSAVAPILNYERDGRPVLVPEVREYKPRKGVCKLPERLTVAAPEGEELIVEEIAAELKRFGGIAVADKTAFCRFTITDRDVPGHPQGYTLTVAPDGIDVISLTTDGLFHGAQTLVNLLRNAAAPELKCCRITDQPDFERRGYFFTIRNLPPKNIPYLKRTLDAMAKLKMNWILLELAEAFPFRDNPLTLRKNAFTREEVLDIIEFCRKRHIEITPSLQVWSHAQWMTFHPDWETKMSEGRPNKRWNSQPCPYSQEALDLTRMAVEEHLELFRPKCFFLMMDELGHGPFQSCPRCKKADRVQLFSRIVKFAQDLVFARGVIPIVCQDSFTGKSKHWGIGDQLRASLDPRTQILWWSYRDKLPEDQIVPFKGSKLIGHSLSGKPFNTHNMLKLIKKYGGRDSTIVYWYFSGNGLLSTLGSEMPDSLGGFVNGADYMWRFRETPYPELGYDGTFEMMRLIYPEKVVAAPAAEAAQPIPLERSANAELSLSPLFPSFNDDDETSELAKVLAGLPERFRLMTSKGGRYYGLRLTGSAKDKEGRQAVRFALGDRKIRELAFLLTASRPSDPLAYAGSIYYGVKRYSRPVVAKICLEYADGEKRTVELKYRDEIIDWNRPFGGFDMRFAVRGVDALKRYYSFGIYDLVNPEPEKPLRFLTFSTGRVDGISPVMLAVSARGADKPFPKPGKIVPAAVAGRPGVSDDLGKPRMRIAADFENGMGNVIVTVPKSIRENLHTEIVNDPTSPSGSKVLKITVTPGEYSGRKTDEGLLRVSVDLPYSVPKGTKAFTVDHKLVFGGLGFSHANDYLIETDQKPKPDTLYRMQRLSPKSRWSRDIVPITVRSNTDYPLKDLTKTKYRRLSFFFNKIDAPLELYVDNIGDTTENCSEMSEWFVGTEAEPI